MQKVVNLCYEPIVIGLEIKGKFWLSIFPLLGYLRPDFERN
jgi:hypothetical protein